MLKKNLGIIIFTVLLACVFLTLVVTDMLSTSSSKKEENTIAQEQVDNKEEDNTKEEQNKEEGKPSESKEEKGTDKPSETEKPEEKKVEEKGEKKEDTPTPNPTPTPTPNPTPAPEPKAPEIPNADLIEAYFLNTINNSSFKVEKSYGNNDAFIFKTYNNKYILLDTGVTRTDENLPSYEIIDMIYNKLKSLQNKNVVTIDYMIISHMHWDHAGNAPTILNDSRFDIKNTIFKREKIQPLDEKIYDAAVKNGKTNIIESNNKLQEGSYYTLDDNIKMYLFNVKDVFANATSCKSGMPYYNYLIDQFRDVNAVRDGILTGENKYLYFNGLEVINNESNFSFHSRTAKPTTAEINTSDYLNNKFWVVKQENGYNCNANTNSIVVVFQVRTKSGNKYIYLPGDLENNGYDPFGEYDNNYKTTIHGGIATYPYFYKESNGYPFAFFDGKKLRVDTFYTLYKVPAEYAVAKQVTNKFSDMAGNITIYQESHHGLNNAPEALDVLKVNSNKTYSITPAGTDPRISYQYRILRGQYYLGNSNIMFTGGSDKNGIKCAINGSGKTTCNKY